MVPGGIRVIRLTPQQWERPVSFWPLGDIHWSSAACDEELFAKTRVAIASDPMARWLGMGDYCDLISLRDPKRFQGETIDPKFWVTILKSHGPTMIRHMVTELGPIKGQGLGLLAGNHEKTYSERFEQQIVPDAATGLGLPYLGYSTILEVRLVRIGRKPLCHKFRICAHHGAGGAQTRGGKLNRVERFAQDFDADVYFYGHIHDVFDLSMIELGGDADCTQLLARPRVAVATGSYYRAYADLEGGATTYAEMRGLRPSPLGSPCVKIVPSTGALSIQKPGGQLQWRE